MTLVPSLLVLALLIGALGFFSLAETALFSLRPWRVERLRRERPGAGDAIARLLADPLRLVVTIVLGAEVASIAAGNLSAILRREHLGGWGEWGIVLAVGGTSALMLLFGEISPKTLAAGYPEWVALWAARPLALASTLAAPLTRPLAFLSSRLGSTGHGAGGVPMGEADFRLIVDAAVREGVLEQREVEMIGAVLRLGDLPVRAVMVPRTDIAALPAGTSVGEALAHVRRSRHSRVPLYEGDLDHIVGILYAKDLLGMDDETNRRRPSRESARPVFFVPEMMRARQLLREFQARRLHLAIVVDEYGGTAGLVSLEDLLEEIVGDIADDYDRPLLMWRAAGKSSWWARGALPFSEFKRRFRARAKPGDYDTLGGYVLALFGRFPGEGERIGDGQFVYTVLRAPGRRLVELGIETPPAVERKGPGSSPGPSVR